MGVPQSPPPPLGKTLKVEQKQVEMYILPISRVLPRDVDERGHFICTNFQNSDSGIVETVLKFQIFQKIVSHFQQTVLRGLEIMPLRCSSA